MKDIRKIAIRANYVGDGVVQTDSESQKNLIGKCKNIDLKILKNDNVSFAKKNFFVKDGELQYKLKVTGDCYKNVIRDNIQRVTSQVTKSSDILTAILMSQPLNLMTGWCAMEGGTNGVTKSSSLKFMDIRQNDDTISHLEVYNSTDLVSQTSTSLHYLESIGEINYVQKGSEIDLKNLQFMLNDALWNKLSVPTNIEEKLIEQLKLTLPNFNQKFTYYKYNDSIKTNFLINRGILFTNEQVIFIVKDFLKRFLLSNLKKRNSFIKPIKIEIKLISNPEDDEMKDNPTNPWITLTSIDDIDNLNFEIHQYFKELTIDEIDNYLSYVKQTIENILDTEKEKKERKRLEKLEKERKRLEKLESDDELLRT